MGIWNIVYLVVDNYCIYIKKMFWSHENSKDRNGYLPIKNFGLHVTIFFLLQAPKFFISCAFFFPFPSSSVLLSSQADHTPFQALAHHHLLLPHLHVQAAAAAAASGRSRSNSGELLTVSSTDPIFRRVLGRNPVALCSLILREYKSQGESTKFLVNQLLFCRF